MECHLWLDINFIVLNKELTNSPISPSPISPSPNISNTLEVWNYINSPNPITKQVQTRAITTNNNDNNPHPPPTYHDLYTQACVAFTHKLQCQVFALLSASPSPDKKGITARLDELAERIVQIGFLGEVGEVEVRKGNRVRAKWGAMSIKEICFLVKRELVLLREVLEVGLGLGLRVGDRVERVCVAEVLVGVLEGLLF
ncbi:hypothetical protein N7535_003118 [Penicillium sp. DV-2018c]|nr:hypothetical protein N7461_001190 [Penicillium sp. DV-2018c]KAJ5576192.1 hypothetical protein N7535_003118 [Penicillium sp. DV-2018c]